MLSNRADHSDSNSQKYSKNPPPNVAEGGIWGTISSRTNEPKACALLMIAGCLQEREAYAVWGKIRDNKGNEVGEDDVLLYDTEGNLLGPRKNFRWAPNRKA